MIPIRAAIPDRYYQALTVSKRAGRGILLRRTKTARNRAVRDGRVRLRSCFHPTSIGRRAREEIAAGASDALTTHGAPSIRRLLEEARRHAAFCVLMRRASNSCT
jgi:hypothetical protein